MSRPRKPDNVREIEGERRRRRAEPKPAGAFTRLPRNLNDAERKVWKGLRPDVLALGTVTSADAYLVLGLVEALTHREACWQALAEHGELIEGQRSALVENPAARGWRSSTALAAKLAAELGFTPRGRAALGVDVAPPPRGRMPVHPERAERAARLLSQ